jgi:hypothetical protein
MLAYVLAASAAARIPEEQQIAGYLEACSVA